MTNERAEAAETAETAETAAAEAADTKAPETPAQKEESTSVFGMISKFFSSIWTSFTGVLGSLFNTLKGQFNAATGMGSTFVRNTAEGVSNGFNACTRIVSATAGPIFSNLGSFFTSSNKNEQAQETGTSEKPKAGEL